MRKVGLGAALGLALACAGGDEAPAPDSAPQGRWMYDESCGENAGGTPVFVGYQISIDGEEARIEADGYQTMLRTVGAVSQASDGVWTVRYTRPGEEGYAGYLQPGDAMITFTVEDGDLMVTPAELIFNCTETTLFTRG